MATIKPDFAKILPPHLQTTLGPLIAGVFVDGLDLATLGPIGLVAGPFVGGLAGWWLGGQYQLRTGGRVLMTALTAAYCFAPMTEMIPLATIASLLVVFAGKSHSDHAPSTPPLETTATVKDEPESAS